MKDSCCDRSTDDERQLKPRGAMIDIRLPISWLVDH